MRPKRIKRSFLDAIGAFSVKYRDYAILMRPDDIKLDREVHNRESYTSLAPREYQKGRDEDALDALRDLKQGIGEGLGNLFKF